MKKNLLVLLFLSLVSIGTAKAGDGLYFGPKVGVNFSSLSDVANKEMQPGFNIGVTAGYDFLFIGVDASAMYRKATTSITDDVEMSSNYISVPIMARWYAFGPLYLTAGPQFDFALSSDLKGSVTSIVDSPAESAVVSGVIGCGVKISKIDVGLTYNFGLTSAITDKIDLGDFETGTLTAKNRCISLSAAIHF